MQNHFGRDKAGTSIMLVERNAFDFNEVNNAALILPWLIQYNNLISISGVNTLCLFITQCSH